MCILLVEDEFYIRDIVTEYLREAGFEVIEAEDGHKAIQFVRNPPTNFTILITDLHMPGGMDGFELATETRVILPDLPIVIATGRPDKLEPSWQHKSKHRLLVKPYLPSQLTALIQTLT